MALAGEMLLNADGLVVNSYQDAEGRGAYFPGSSGTSEGQFLFIIGNLRAYQATGNPIAKEAAELALKNLLRVVYRNVPVPDAVDRTHIFAPHWLFNVKYPFASSEIFYDKAYQFTDGVAYITGYGDKVRYVFGARSLNSKLLWQNPYSPLSSGTAYPVASYERVNGDVKVTLTTPFNGRLYVTHSAQVGPLVQVNEPFEAWPDWRKLENGEVACAVDVFVWAYRAFILASQVFLNPTWAKAAEMTRQQAAIAFNVNDSRDWLKPTWTNSPFASGSRFSYSTRVPAPIYSVLNGNVVMQVQSYSSGAHEIQYGNASVKDVYRSGDYTLMELAASERMEIQVFIDLYQNYAPNNRYTATIEVNSRLKEYSISRTAFRNPVGTVLPAGSPVYTFGVSSSSTKTHSVTIGRIRQMPAREVLYYPGAVPFTANFQGLPPQLIDWRGPIYMGYQSPYMWRVIGNVAAAKTDVQLLADAQQQWRTQTGETDLGPFAPVFIFDRDDAVQYGAPNTFGWEGPDPNTRWGGYQYRPLPELLEAAHGLAPTDPLRVSALQVAENFIDWLAQDWPWLPMWPTWANTFSQTIERSLALFWYPTPVTPEGANAFAHAINKASAHRYTEADTEVPMLPQWEPHAAPFLPEIYFEDRPPLGPPTDFPKGPAEINYPEPHMAALILRSVVMADEIIRPLGNNSGVMRIQHRAVLHKCMALLEALWQTEGVMAGTFSHNPAAHEWYGFWHGEILDTLAHVVTWAERPTVNRPSIAAEARIWIDGLLRWAKMNTQQAASPYGAYPWRHRHNWVTPVVEEFEFATTVYTSFSGREQRSSTRTEPRRRLTLWHTLEGSDAQTYEAVLRAKQNKPMLVPQWHLAYQTVDLAPAGQAYLDVDTTDLSLITWGGQVAVSSGTGVIMLTVRSVLGNRLTLDPGLTVAVPARSKVMPVYNALINGDTSSSRRTGSVLEAQAVFRFLPQEDRRTLPVRQPGMTMTVGSDTREVITRRPNWISEPSVDHKWDFNVSDSFVNGPIVPINGRDQGTRHFQARWSLLSRDEIEDYLGLIQRLHGRRYAAWMPSWSDDFQMTRDVAAESRTRLYVKPNAFLELGLMSDRAVGIFIRLTSGQCFAARVSSVVPGVNEAVLVLDRGIPAFGLGSLDKVCVLYRVRQVSDTSTIEWVTDSVAQATASFTSVFDET